MNNYIKFVLCLFFVFPALCHAEPRKLTTISPVEAATLIQEHQNDSNFVLLDIRTPGEFKSGHIKNAVLLDFRSASFEGNLDKLNKNKTYLIYCRTANRSGKALTMMKKKGFTKVYNMGKGLVGWRAAKLPIVTEKRID